MTNEYSISVDDWQDARWNHAGRDTMYNYYLNNRAAKKEAKDSAMEIDEFATEKADDHFPMMLYAYPIYSEPSEEEIIAVCTKTNCTVVEDTETGDWFLALSGGGMDLSQDIALAYLLIGERIPTALAINVCTQPHLSVSQKEYLKIMKAIKYDLRIEIGNYKNHIKEINNEIKRSREKQSQKENPPVITA